MNVVIVVIGLLSTVMVTTMCTIVRAKPKAIVIGGSFAGLVSARSLSEHYDVTLIEKDSTLALSSSSSTVERLRSRPSVPQGKHIHILLAQGSKILEELFPGVKADLVKKGGEMVDFPAVYANCIDGRFHQRDPNSSYDISTILCSRVLIEETVRERVSKLPGVNIISGGRVTSLLREGSRVSGVVCRVVDHVVNASIGEDTALHADLIVDTMGRGTRSSEWLKKLGFGVPEEEVSIFLRI